MAFTDDEIATFTEQIERILWTHRRPPLHLRNMVREGQRIEGNEIEIFEERPYFRDKSQWIKSPVPRPAMCAAATSGRSIGGVVMENGILTTHVLKPAPWRNGSISSTRTSMDASGDRQSD